MDRQIIKLIEWGWRHRDKVKHAKIVLTDGRTVVIDRKGGRWTWQVTP